MTLCRLIAPKWLNQPPKEGYYTDEQIQEYNSQGYNVYYWPNHPSAPVEGNVNGTHIDVWNYVFVDFDLKYSNGLTKTDFVNTLLRITPSRIVDSGGGIHAYWKVSDLDAKSYLRLCRRLIRYFNSDPAVGTLAQLMRLPETVNTKDPDNFILCTTASETNAVYTCEELDAILPPITVEDETHCVQHYDKAYGLNQDNIDYSDDLPPKFGKLLDTNKEAKEIWASTNQDRSRSDFRLAHLMFANSFTKAEAMSVLVNTAKALARAPIHRHSYAQNIVDKIWTYELADTKAKPMLSESVASLLSRNDSEQLKGRRFRCYDYFDGTASGFRLTQVMGLVAGVGVGKTAIALNAFKGFVSNNPDYIHMFVSLEMPGREIAARWAKMCGTDTSLHSKVHILSNYNEDGSYRNLSLNDIQEYILKFQEETGLKVGCVCIDHIGVLKREDKSGEFQGLRDVCAQMKAFAIATETFLIMQSQTNREKAGIGDLELFKDAAYGTQDFESYVDYMLVCWQPLKRCYDNIDCPRVTAYKFAKIRSKDKNDSIIEDQCYRLLFNQDFETLRPMTEAEETAFDYYQTRAVNLRKKDRKTDLVEYKSVPTVGVKVDESRKSNSH